MKAESPAESNFPVTGRLLGVDYGTKRVGTAVSTAEQNIASPLENYTRQNSDRDAAFYLRLKDEYGIAGVVVGLPVHTSGDESQKSREAREYGAWLSGVVDLPVVFHDERYTSLQAESHLLDANLTKKKRKARLDMLAAQIMLQSYLDAPDPV